MAFTSAPLNVYEAMVDDQRRPSKTFLEWATSLGQDVDAAPARLSAPITLVGQTASISTTAIPTAALSDGAYRFSFYARITTPATTSSSLTVTFSWTENGVSLSKSFPAITGNTTTTADSGTFLAVIDAATPLSYGTTYASVGATAMAYRLTLVAEQVAA